jgi:uncharacterized protein YjbJ (UPF0337 family)
LHRHDAPQAGCVARQRRPASARVSPPELEDHHMNSDTIQGNWTQLKGKVQQQWGKLTSDDLDQIEGQRKQLVGRVQERYGYAREQAEKEVNHFLDNLH